MSDRRMTGLTVVVLTFNEEPNIRACLTSIAGWAERTVVVDSGSTDGTVAVARELGAEVVEHAFDNYGLQRNWALQNLSITTPWVFNLDADERVTPALRTSIADAVKIDRAGIDGFLCARLTVFMGQPIRHGGHYPTWHLRLFRTGRGRCEDKLYDQHFHVDGRVETLTGDLIDTFAPDLSTFTRRHARWARLEARELTQGEPQRQLVGGRLGSRNPVEVRRWWRAQYDALPLFVRPLLYFLYRYVLRAGFLDGRRGLVFHVLQGFWFKFLVDANILELRGQPTAGPDE